MLYNKQLKQSETRDCTHPSFAASVGICRNAPLATTTPSLYKRCCLRRSTQPSIDLGLSSLASSFCLGQAYTKRAVQLIDDCSVWDGLARLVLIDDGRLLIDGCRQLRLGQLLRQTCLLERSLELVRDSGVAERLCVL